MQLYYVVSSHAYSYTFGDTKSFSLALLGDTKSFKPCVTR